MKYVLLSVFCACSLSIFSQISWIAKAGVNMSRVTNENNIDMNIGYQAGVGLDYYFSKNWGIQSSFMLITKGFKSKGNYNYPPEWNVNLSKYNKTDNRMYLEIPIMLGYRFNLAKNVKLVFNGGAYASYGIRGKYKNRFTQKDGSIGEDDYNIFSSGTEKFDVGIGGGSTIEYIDKYTLGIIGEWGLLNSLGNSKNQTYGINLGYKF